MIEKSKEIIRDMVLDGKSSEIRMLLLTETQIKIVRRISEYGEVTASKLSKEMGVSVQNASSKLTTLYYKGYLARDIETAKTGGIEYVHMAYYR